MTVIVAGETSGDLYGSLVARKLKDRMPEIELKGMGGELMAEAGVELLHRIDDTAVMGVSEVFGTIPRLLRKRHDLKNLMRREKPVALLLIDFGDFNVGLAKFATKLGIPVIYYIPPKAWAWRSHRAKKIAKVTTVVASIFPFEAEFYRRAGAKVEFVGHPLSDLIAVPKSRSEARKALALELDRPVIGLLPGSRFSEVDRLLPVMLEVVAKLSKVIPSCQFVLPIAPNLELDPIHQIPKSVKIVSRSTYTAMAASDLLVVASGTATLEATLIETPMIIIYKVTDLTWIIARTLVKLKHSGLPNIIADREIVPELLQSEVEADRLSKIALELLQNDELREQQKLALRELGRQLKSSENVSDRVATLLLNESSL